MKSISPFIGYNPDKGSFFYTKPCGRKRIGQPAGSLASRPPMNYILLRIDGKNEYAHRAVMKAYGYNIEDLQVDHINGDGLDNRLCNLRVVDSIENNRNSALQKRNEVGVTGVYKRGGKYVARITVNSKNMHIGTFSTLDEAAQARQLKEMEFGFHENHGRSNQKH